MKIRKSDNVMIISGKDRGKNGKVLEVFPKENKIRIEGINLRKKHTRPKRQGQKGQVVLIPLPISASNAMLICSSCNKPRRVGYKVFSASAKGGPASGGKGNSGSASSGENKKTRVCKKCGSEI